jgi:hypothetical protein
MLRDPFFIDTKFILSYNRGNNLRIPPRTIVATPVFMSFVFVVSAIMTVLTYFRTFVPWWATNPDTWTGYEIMCFMLNPFIPSPPPPFEPNYVHYSYIYLRRILLPPTLVVSFEASTNNSCAGQCRAAATIVFILSYYRFKICKYGEWNKYVRLFRSEQEFGVSRDFVNK